jgi:hypothetical protein
MNDATHIRKARISERCALLGAQCPNPHLRAQNDLPCVFPAADKLNL